MVDLQLLKTITSKEVAIRYIGLPEKEKNNKLWYKSPFRNEKTASFCVSNEKGFHDFGDSWHGDTVEFIKRYFNLSFKDAISMLATDFGIDTSGEYETAEIIKFKKMQREAKLRKAQLINLWFNKTFDDLCYLYWEWQEIVNRLSGRIDLNIYKIALDKTLILEYLLETFIDYSKNKEVLYNVRGQIECRLI